MKVNNKILVHAISKELTFCFTIQHVPLSVEVETRHPKNQRKKTKTKTKRILLLLNGKEYSI